MVTIIADTTCSIPQDDLKKLGIPILPQIIVFGNEQYRDDSEITTGMFLQKLKASSTLPKTAAPSPALYNPIYKQELEKGNSIVVITPSAELSGTYRSASVATEEFKGADIRILDTKSIAGGLGSIVLDAYRLAASGATPDEIVDRVEYLSARQRTYFVVDTLEYLYKGGRIGGASALFGSILQVKPILTMKNGRVEAAETQRTKKRALDRIVEIVDKECRHDPSGSITISECDNIHEANLLAEQFRQITHTDEIPIYEIPPAIVVHAGPKVLAIGFFTD